MCCAGTSSSSRARAPSWWCSAQTPPSAASRWGGWVEGGRRARGGGLPNRLAGLGITDDGASVCCVVALGLTPGHAALLLHPPSPAPYPLLPRALRPCTPAGCEGRVPSGQRAVGQRVSPRRPHRSAGDLAGGGAGGAAGGRGARSALDACWGTCLRRARPEWRGAAAVWRLLAARRVWRGELNVLTSFGGLPPVFLATLVSCSAHALCHALFLDHSPAEFCVQCVRKASMLVQIILNSRKLGPACASTRLRPAWQAPVRTPQAGPLPLPAQRGWVMSWLT